MAGNSTKTLESGLSVLRRPEGYLAAGYPRFMGLFARDALISSMELMHYDPSVARGTLLELARLQGRRFVKSTNEEPGKIIHEYNDPAYISREWFWIFRRYRPWLKLGVPSYYSVDSTPLFIITASEYYRHHNDPKFIRGIWGNIDRASSWIAEHVMKGGLLSYKRIDDRCGLASQSWKDGPRNSFEGLRGNVAVVEAQGYAYSALKAAAELGDEIGMQLRVDTESAAEAVKESYNSLFWDRGAESAVAVANGKAMKQMSSNVGHLLFTGILDRVQESQVIDHLFSRSMYTAYGIRTESSDSNGFDEKSYQNGSVWPHDNWLIAKGLKSSRAHLYRKIRDAIMKAYAEKGTIPEFYGVSGSGKLIPDWRMSVPPCNPQAWSSGAVISFIIER